MWTKRPVLQLWQSGCGQCWESMHCGTLAQCQNLCPLQACPTRLFSYCCPLTLPSCVQASLERVGIDATAAVQRARSQSRGRKRTRSEAPAQDVEMTDAQPKKRIHSSKSRYAHAVHGVSVAATHGPNAPLSCLTVTSIFKADSCAFTSWCAGTGLQQLT